MTDPNLGPSRSQVNSMKAGINHKIPLRNAKKRAKRDLAWLLLFVAIFAATEIVYAVVASSDAPNRGWSVLYGVVASLICIGCILFCIHRLVKARREVKRYEQQQ